MDKKISIVSPTTCVYMKIKSFLRDMSENLTLRSVWACHNVAMQHIYCQIFAFLYIHEQYRYIQWNSTKLAISYELNRKSDYFIGLYIYIYLYTIKTVY